MDHIYRVGRQYAALRAGGRMVSARKIHKAATRFIEHFGRGEEGRVSLSSVYRMAQMEDPKKSLWMGAWR